jgi:hypothetical protein
LAHSNSSESKRRVAALADAAPVPLAARLAEITRRGVHGTRIQPHRAFLRLESSRARFIAAAILPVPLCLAWVYANPWIVAWWVVAIERSRRALALPGETTMVLYAWGPMLRLAIPVLSVASGPPSRPIWIATAAATAVVGIGTFALPQRFLPLAFVVRAVVFVQSTSLAYFYFIPGRFPYTIADYTLGGLWVGFILVGAVPLLFGLTFYIFDFGIPIEVGLTLLVMLHLAVLLPFQYVLHAYLLHRFSLLLMPVLFSFFGLVIEVLLCIALYGWGVSWNAAVERNRKP